MEKHYGQVVEYIVRKNGYSITELADSLNVNRRSVYNYFQNRNLKRSVIYQIGLIVRHNFAIDFPELFESTEFDKNNRRNVIVPSFDTSLDEMIWKDKYIQLLEKYNNALHTRIMLQTDIQLSTVN